LKKFKLTVRILTNKKSKHGQNQTNISVFRDICVAWIAVVATCTVGFVTPRTDTAGRERRALS